MGTINLLCMHLCNARWSFMAESDLFNLVGNVFFNLVVLILLIRFLYYPGSKRKDFLFTFIGIGVTVHIMCYLLNNVKIELGFALGLFAIFGIIRYRTTTIAIKEMTYLFVVIALSVINSISGDVVKLFTLIAANVVIVSTIAIFERYKGSKRIFNQSVLYEKIELIKPEMYDELIKDLSERTGCNVIDVSIERINFLNDTAEITMFYTVDRKRRET